MVSTSPALGECTLEWVGDVSVFHKVHEAGVENAGEYFSKAAGDGYGAVVGRVVFRAFFVEGGNICLLSLLGEVGGVVYVVE